MNKTLTKKDYLSCYGLKMVNAKKLWNKGCTGKGKVVAVIDTGCCEHSMLQNNVIGGKNFTCEDNADENNYIDYNGHGTHVAGIISLVAPDAKLLILKALDKSGGGSYKCITEAIKYAISQNVDVISMSLGGLDRDESMYSAIKDAIRRNISVVCAAGNDGDGDSKTEENNYPGAYNEVIEVGAIDKNYKITDFSNSNKNIDLVAPGEGIVSTYLNNEYKKLSGTSQATPFVSGILVLLKQYFEEQFGRELTEMEMYSHLVKNTIDLEDVSRTMQGNGYLRIK